MSESTSRVQRVVAIEDLIRADPAVTSLGQFRWRTFLWTLAATLGYVLFPPSLLGWGVVALQRVVRVHLWDGASPLC
jgi:hypothetical protein